jgi:hypothetical protein
MEDSVPCDLDQGKLPSVMEWTWLTRNDGLFQDVDYGPKQVDVSNTGIPGSFLPVVLDDDLLEHKTSASDIFA